MPYNPYMQGPYPQPNYGFNPQPQPQTNTYAFVNGIEGAKSFPMQPNQTVMLMDSDNPIAYMKQSNAMGQATIKCFKLVETNEEEIRGRNAKPMADYATKADLAELAKKVEALMNKGE